MCNSIGPERKSSTVANRATHALRREQERSYVRAHALLGIRLEKDCLRDAPLIVCMAMRDERQATVAHNAIAKQTYSPG